MRTYTYPQYNYFNVTEIPFEEIKKIDIAKCKEPTQTVQAYYAEAKVKPDVVMNGGMFVMATGNTIFSLRDESKTLITDYKNKDGFGIIGDNTLAVGRIDDGQNYRDFISAYPTLIEDKKPCNTSKSAEIDYKTRRTIVAWDTNNFYMITVEKSGMKFAEIQKILVKMGVVYAANLDGGGSTCKLVNGKKVTTQAYNRPVDNVVCVYLKKNEPKPKKYLYRVQVGAFSKKENAVALQQQIRNMGWSGAYVRIVNGLYKVQIGAFGVLDNANVMVKELKAKGVNAFVAVYEV